MIIGSVKWVYFLLCRICGRLAYVADSLTEYVIRVYSA